MTLPLVFIGLCVLGFGSFCGLLWLAWTWPEEFDDYDPPRRTVPEPWRMRLFGPPFDEAEGEG